MLFPPSERVIYDQNPLEEVICQFRFPPILAIGAEAPATFQDALRDDYPLYEAQGTNAPPPELLPLLSQVGVGAPTVSHHFSTPDHSGMVTLATDFIALTERRYVRWEQFRSEVDRILLALAEVYRPAFYQRIGLRYRDAIDRERLGLGHVPWGELLTAELAGFFGSPGALSNFVTASRSEAVLALPDPPDAQVLVQAGLGKVGEREVFIIDADFFIEGRKEKSDGIAILDDFNRDAGNFFRWSISSLLRDALVPRALESHDGQPVK